MTAKIEVPIKPAIKSWGFMGSAVAAGATLFVGVQTALQTPGGLAALCGNLQDKYGGIALIVLGIGGSLYGNIKRPEVFLRPGKLREATQRAANNAMQEMTGTEMIATANQAWDLIMAPAGEKFEKAADFITATHERMSATDERLARIEAAVTAQQFPPLADLPPEPPPARQQVDRGQSFRVPPPLMGGPGIGEQMPVGEPDVTETNDGVFLI